MIGIEPKPAQNGGFALLALVDHRSRSVSPQARPAAERVHLRGPASCRLRFTASMGKCQAAPAWVLDEPDPSAGTAAQAASIRTGLRWEFGRGGCRACACPVVLAPETAAKPNQDQQRPGWHRRE